MNSIRAGRELHEFVKLCYCANRPFLISGSHGIGKSEMLEQAAAELGIGFISRDLSLMEPPDLIGLPKAENGVTTYAPPKFLPRDGKGLLMFEELNRCEKYMRAPCLQLLTARKLNDYELAPGWLPVAAINPSDGDYEVDELDPALISRFVCIELIPNVSEWLRWAAENPVHSAVQRYAKSDTSIFDSPNSNPRAWKYVSDLVRAAEEQKTPIATLQRAVMGTVGEERSAAFLATYQSSDRALTASDVLESYGAHRAQVSKWIDAGRLDLVQASLHNVLLHLQPRQAYTEVRANRTQWNQLGQFLYDLPGDMRRSAEESFKERKYDIPRPGRTKALGKRKRSDVSTI